MTVNHRFLRHLVYAWWKINKGGSLQTHENVFNILRWPRYILLTRYHSKMKTPTPYRIKRTTVQKQKTNSFPASHLSERYLPYGGRKKNKLYSVWIVVIRESVTKHKKRFLIFFFMPVSLIFNEASFGYISLDHKPNVLWEEATSFWRLHLRDYSITYWKGKYITSATARCRWKCVAERMVR